MIQYFPIVTGSLTVNGDLIVTGTGSMSASLALNSNLLQGTGSTGFATTASLLAVSSSQQQISASLLTLTASYTELSSSYTALSGSYNTFSGSASTRITVDSASLLQVSSSQQQISASLLNVVANYATTGSNSFRANQSITGSLVVSSTITAQTLVVQTVTSSILYSSGSNVFGNQLANTQTFTGSVNITGSQTVFGNVGTNYAAQSNIRSYIYDNSANYGLVVQQDGSGTIAQFSGNSGAVRMYISASGNVGIGVTNPTRQLFVNDTVFFDNVGNGSTTNPSIAIGSTSLGISYLGGSNMALLTGGSTKMFISASGIIGIGATIPVGKLNLVGSTAQYIVLTNTAADGVTDAIQGGIIGQSRGSANNLAQMASILFRNKATSPWYKGEITFSTNDTDGTDPSVAVIERMRITSAGNIGIGVTNPAAKLEVNGTIYSAIRSSTIDTDDGVSNNFQGYGGYWALRTDLSNNFNLDVYGNGTPKNVLNILQTTGAATFSNTVSLSDVLRINASSTTSVSTSATTISTGSNTYGGLAIVWGADASGNIWTDLLFYSLGQVYVIRSQDISGGPFGRTYTVNGSGSLRLTMGGGTYTVRYQALLTS